MPPGTPGISLFSTWLRYLKSVRTTTVECLKASGLRVILFSTWLRYLKFLRITTVEGLRPSDSIMPVLLSILLPAVSCFIKFTLEHVIDRRIWNKVPSRGTRVVWCKGTVTWYQQCRECGLTRVGKPDFLHCWLSLCETFRCIGF